MRETLDKKIEEINQKLMDMTCLVEGNIENSIIALINQDTVLAQDILDKDLIINEQETEIETLCVTAMATQVPVASDLRRIFSIQKIITDLERVGDNCCNIADIVKSLGSYDLIVSIDNLVEMAKKSKKMIFDSMTAFVNSDLELAKATAQMDDEVDQMYEALYRSYLDFIKKDDPNEDQVIGLILAGRYYERVADHATNICERLIYMTTGEIVKY